MMLRAKANAATQSHGVKGRKCGSTPVAWLICIVAFCLVAVGAQKMAQQPKYVPLAASTFFPDKQSARTPVLGTVARDYHDKEALELSVFKSGLEYVDSFPFPITRAVLARGRERYNIYCAVCHGRNGDGPVVQSGFSPPPSLYTDKGRGHPIGWYFDIITNGYGAMGRYGYQVNERDRWAIIAHIRELQQLQPRAQEPGH
jgi:hypothetical protein